LEDLGEVKTMIIGHFVDSLELGGMEITVLALAKHQMEQGHKVLIACLLRKGELVARAEALGIGVHCFQKPPGPRLSAVRAVAKWIRSEKLDVVHTHNEVPMIYAAAAAQRNQGLVVLNTRHDMGLHQSRKITDFAYRWYSKRVTANVAVCEAAKRQFQVRKLFSLKRSHVVPNGIDVTLLNNVHVKESESLKRQFNIGKESILIGSIGRLTSVKAVDRQINAFNAVAQQFPLVHLVIVGDGPERERLENIPSVFKDRIHFLGKRSDVPQVLSQLDIFIQSSITEGHSIALLEAAAAGVPVIATDVGGNNEIVQNGSTGMLVKDFVEEKYALALSQLLSNPALRKNMSNAAQTWASENATIHTMAERYFQIYRSTRI
jgi:glycosyltransferase involved in cell wall biosynthesis